MGSIADNLKAVEGRIEQAASGVNRDPGQIKLIAVSKTIPIPLIKE